MRQHLTQAFESRPPLRLGEGEALCVWQGGQELLHLSAGQSRSGVCWSAESLVPVFSATKALSASCVLLALHDQGLSPAEPIGEFWADFPAPHATVGQLLSHQVGLAAWDTEASLFDLDACRAAIERTSPAWLPPEHGYHPHTYGPMLDVLMLCLTGQRIGAFWEQRVRSPLGLDAYIGLPESLFHRVAELRAPRLHGAMPRTEFYRRYFDPSSPVHRAFHCVSGLPSIREMNSPRAWQCACPARGGVASARGLAMFYQALQGLLPGSPFPPAVLEWMRTPQCSGYDHTLLQHSSFTCGAMCEPAELFGCGGFGHAGAGGFHAFAEPASGLSFAYVMNQMQLGVLPGDRVRSLLSALHCDPA